VRSYVAFGLIRRALGSIQLYRPPKPHATQPAARTHLPSQSLDKRSCEPLEPRVGPCAPTIPTPSQMSVYFCFDICGLIGCPDGSPISILLQWISLLKPHSCVFFVQSTRSCCFHVLSFFAISCPRARTHLIVYFCFGFGASYDGMHVRRVYCFNSRVSFLLCTLICYGMTYLTEFRRVFIIVAVISGCLLLAVLCS